MPGSAPSTPTSLNFLLPRLARNSEESRTQQIPRVSMRNWPKRKHEISKQLAEACENVGFFCLVDHGISIAEIRVMFRASQQFFALPDNVKSTVPFAANRGWEKQAQIRPSTGTADLKESLQLQFHGMEGKWLPEEQLPNFKQVSESFMKKCHELSLKVMECLAMALGLAPDIFTRGHNVEDPNIMSVLRCIHYHDITGQSFPPNYWRAGAHTDWDILTLLFQRPDESGLELCAGREASTDFAWGDTWIPVEPVEGVITCNIGDMLMRWSDDRFKSNFHRVRTPKVGEYQGPRYSLAYFNQGSADMVIEGPKGKYPTITAGDFLAEQIQRNYTAKLEMDRKRAAAAAAASNANGAANIVVTPPAEQVGVSVRASA